MIRISFLLLFFLIGMPAFSDAYPLTASGKIAWESHKIEIEVNISIPRPDPFTRDKALNEVMTSQDVWIKTALSPLLVTSEKNIGELWVDDPLFPSAPLFETFLNPKGSYFNDTMNALIYRYEIDLIPTIFSYGTNEDPLPLPQTAGYYGGGNYTGLVIYVPPVLPVRGEAEASTLNPALMPRILDEDMRIVVDHTRINRDYLERWGVVRYTNEIQEYFDNERVGAYPCKTMAKEIFGLYHSDIIISQDIAKKLLATPQNRKILEEGRIMIIH